MIKEVKGDLIEAFKKGDVNVIAHCCNCFHTMGAGVAKAIAKAFPEALEEDRKTLYGDKHKLGQYSVAHTKHGSIYNLYGQYRYGRDKQHLDYEALRYSLIEMSASLYPSGVKIGLPRLGCNLAGGDWSIVKGIIEETLEGFDVTVYYL